MQTKLSYLQKWALKMLLEDHVAGVQWDEEFKREHPQERGLHDQTKIWGVHWKPKKWMPQMSRSDSVNLSRAIARLESRGLLIRQNQHIGTPDAHRARTTPQSVPPVRCSHILLTESGFEVARALPEDDGADAIKPI